MADPGETGGECPEVQEKITKYNENVPFNKKNKNL